MEEMARRPRRPGQDDKEDRLYEEEMMYIRGRIYHDSVRKIRGPIRGDFFN